MLDDATRNLLEQLRADHLAKAALIDEALGGARDEATDGQNDAITIKEAMAEFSICEKTARKYASDPRLGFKVRVGRKKEWRLCRSKTRAWILNPRSSASRL
jgi:hypothetical protein